MTAAIMDSTKCSADFDAVSAVLRAVPAMSQSQRSALLHVLNDYVAVLRIRARYLDPEGVDERLAATIAEIGTCFGTSMSNDTTLTPYSNVSSPDAPDSHQILTRP
jgi:hypothetical protein